MVLVVILLWLSFYLSRGRGRDLKSWYLDSSRCCQTTTPRMYGTLLCLLGCNGGRTVALVMMSVCGDGSVSMAVSVVQWR